MPYGPSPSLPTFQLLHGPGFSVLQKVQSYKMFRSFQYRCWPKRTLCKSPLVNIKTLFFDMHIQEDPFHGPLLGKDDSFNSGKMEHCSQAKSHVSQSSSWQMCIGYEDTWMFTRGRQDQSNGQAKQLMCTARYCSDVNSVGRLHRSN